jgi:hypothetical protein
MQRNDAYREEEQVLGIECRATSCRVETEHGDASAQGLLASYLPMEPPFDGEMLVYRSEDPLAPCTVIYGARRGHLLLVTTE